MVPISFLSEAHTDAIYEIATQSFDQPWKKEEFGQFLSHACAYHRGIFENGTLSAYILCLNVMGDLDTLSIATRPGARRRGLGLALLQAVQADPKVRSIFLDVDVSNTGAIALYTTAGFQRMGVRKKYYASLRDALQMRWNRNS